MKNQEPHDLATALSIKCDEVYLIRGSVGGGAHVGERDALDQAQNVLDLLIWDFNVHQGQLSRNLEPEAERKIWHSSYGGEDSSTGMRSYLGILASFSTIHLPSCTVKSIGWRMCCTDDLSNRADFQLSPAIYWILNDRFCKTKKSQRQLWLFHMSL